uniref:Sialin n=1 Tax=Lygus hesperus TaxID=30085 RepID=A0A146L7D8_LYGHE
MGIYNKIPRIPIPACLPMRYLISIECFFGLTISYVIRFCLSLAMIKMASHHKSAQADTESCPYNASEQHANASKGDFEWTEIEQGRVLASMFVGYLVAMIPSGMLGDMLGAGPMLTMGVLLSSVASVLTPLAAYHSSITLCVLRAFLGVFQAMVYAPLHCIVAAWIPPQERGTWSSVVFSGSHAGSFLNGVLTGTFLGPMSLHWSTVFYIYGIAAAQGKALLVESPHESTGLGRHRRNGRSRLGHFHFGVGPPEIHVRHPSLQHRLEWLPLRIGVLQYMGSGEHHRCVDRFRGQEENHWSNSK